MSMKRIYILLLTAVISLPLWAQEPTALWGKAVQGTQGSKVTTQGADLQLAPDGGVYVSGGAGTKTTEDVIRFGNDVIASPETVYTGNGDTGTQNLFITKLTADGQPQWTVFSKNGEVMSSSAYMQVVSDGLMVVFGIHHSKDQQTRSIQLVDAFGQETDLEWTMAAADKRYYRLLLMKLNHEGRIQWVRQTDTDASKDQTFTLYGLVVDAGGSLYVGLKQSGALKPVKSDGTTVTLDAQGINGMLLLKFDRNGYYIDHLSLTGDLSASSLTSMTMTNGRCYLSGTIKGTANGSITLGSKSAILPTAMETLYVTAVNTDLSVDWLRLYESSKSFVINSPVLYAGTSTLWLAGMGSLSLETKTGKTVESSADKNRVAILLKMDNTNGELLDGYAKDLFQTGYFSLFEGDDGLIYAVGYEGLMSVGANQRKDPLPMFIDYFSSDDLTAPVGTWTPMIERVGGGQNVKLRQDGVLFSLTRTNKAKDENTQEYKDVRLMGSEMMTILQDYEGYCATVCAFQLPVRPKPQVIAGDANGDGIVDVSDVVAIVNKILEKPTASFVFEAADMNGDGKVDVSDVLQMIAVMTAK
jgi:hypothetical protein